MSGGPGLFVSVGDDVGRVPGWLRVHAGDDADVPWRPGEDFPFEDRAVDAMDCADFVAALPQPARLGFLLECRRVLKPGGLLSLRVGGTMDGGGVASDPGSGLRGTAALTGLEAADALPVAEVSRRALAARRADSLRAPALAFTKRDRGVGGEPLVSIVIPAYTPRYFSAALDSALAQTYAGIEIVVCDDSAGTEIEAMTRSRSGGRDVRYERNAPRLGPRANFRKCFERARGEFVKFLCDDDLLAPDCVAALLDAFRHAPDITLATSHRRRIDEHGSDLIEQPATHAIVAADTVIAGYTLANAMLMAGLNWVGEPSTALFRKADLLDLAPDYFRFNGVAGHGLIDLVMWSSLLLKGDAAYLRASLSAFRIHPAQRQADPASAQRNIASMRELQAAWGALRLFDKVPPHLLLAKPFPPPAEVDWRLQPVLSPFAVRPVAPAGLRVRAAY